jgi:hypothetical protein
MSASQRALLASGGSNPYLQEARSLESDGTLSYGSMLQILQGAATGGMTSTKIANLQALAGVLNASGGIATSAYVQQIAQDVVGGNSANAFWNGGSSTATPLGNLSAASSETQVDELIGKWFLGTDLPSIAITNPAIGTTGISAQYQATSLPLFGANGPSYQDVSQGNVGDCYFLAALGETAQQDPSQIKSMIQSNGNGTYAVEFAVNGQRDFVTVNDELPVMQGGFQQPGNHSTLEFASGNVAWAPLVEKAYAQLMGQNTVTPGAVLGQHGNSYADTAGGGAQGITLITGRSYNSYGLLSTASAASISRLAAALSSALASGQDVLMGTSDRPVSGNLVASHMFEVLGVDATAGTVTLQNPWNQAVGSAERTQMQFTMSLASLAADNPTFFASTGTPSSA